MLLRTAVIRLALIVLALFAGVAAASAAAGDRVALIIGNGRYVNANALPNPPNDARLMASTLNEIGFDVLQGVDLDKPGMERLIHEFIRKAETARVAILYYAGHGMQVDGRNYLIPVDARLERASDLNFETIDLDRVLDSLNDPNRANIVILDACRDNPLSRSFASKLGSSRSAAVGSGLAAYSMVGTGTLIAFATAPGQVALDGAGTNSPFTVGLVKHMRTPGLEVRQMLTRVRADVAAETHNRQIPWDNSSLLGDVYLTGPATPPEVKPVTPPPVVRETIQPPSVDTAHADEVLWNAIKDSNIAALFDEFMRRFPASPHAQEALIKLSQLRRMATLPPVAPPPPPPPVALPPVVNIPNIPQTPCGGSVILQDNFSRFDSSWGEADRHAFAQNGAGIIRADADKGYKVFNTQTFPTDIDVCVTMTPVDISKPTDSAAGLAFWAKDYTTAHVLLINSLGEFKLGRLINSTWVRSPIDWKKTDALRPGLRQPNLVRVATKGQMVFIEINGRPVAKLLAQAPGEPSRVGMYAESSNKIDTWRFNDFKVTSLR